MKSGFAAVQERFWFAEASPKPLALLRLLFFGWLFLWYWGYDFRAIALHPEELWQPVHLLRVLGLDCIPSERTLDVLQAAWKTTLLSACVGLASRPSALVACLLGAYLLALTHSFHKINHSDGALVLTMGVLALAPIGDVWSLDRLARRWRLGERLAAPGFGGEYWWPIQMTRVLLVLVFLGSGISKLVNGGVAWVWSDHLYASVTLLRATRETLLSVRLPWESHYWLWRALAMGTVAIELAAPLALFSPRARLVIIPGLLSLQIGILLLMGDNFTQFMALYLFWIPWSPLLNARATDR
jgi:hypothetical protein